MPEAADQSRWAGKSRTSTLGYRIFIWLLKTGGLRNAYRLLPFVTAYYRLFVPAAVQPLRYLYRNRMGFGKKEAEKLIRRNLVVFGQTLLDKVAILKDIPADLSFTHEGVAHLEAMTRSGKGGMIVSAHLGNWEVAGHLLRRLETTVNILLYDGEDAEIKAYMEQFESRRSFNIIYVREDLSHIYELNAALKRNELVCLHADRFRPGNRTIAAEFLGKEALFPAGPFILASKLKVPVSFVFAFKDNPGHYHFYAEPATVYEGRGTEGMERMLRDYVDRITRMLKKYPEQWFNYYDFWKNDETN